MLFGNGQDGCMLFGIVEKIEMKLHTKEPPRLMQVRLCATAVCLANCLLVERSWSQACVCACDRAVHNGNSTTIARSTANGFHPWNISAQNSGRASAEPIIATILGAFRQLLCTSHL